MLGKFASMNTFMRNRIAHSHSTVIFNTKNNIVSKEVSFKPIPVKVLAPKAPVQQEAVKVERERQNPSSTRGGKG